MNLFELRGTSFITERKINDINTIKSKIESRLNSMKARTDISDNLMTFSTLKFYTPLGNKWDRIDSFRIIKEGRIAINKESHSLKINWFVKLESLYFLALSCSAIVGIVACVNAELIISTSIGILFFLMFVFIGIVLVKAQLNDLINSCVYRNYY